ncbi:hypothetical protein [Reyranella soli]|uniref:Thioesterase domain-containing protein n=1 Tax=Reyranella soli TaxID=1230389 RepID=A0A512NSG9_9HYPH|nr:hypothetical protein [Reyranella soli]GEP61889.1 hypothetical protein RSO01_90550 [Reyranella soli]
MTSIVIEKRFCGPPKSANGGYVCGLLAAYIDGGAEITLLAPPPLDQRLDIMAGEYGVELRMEGTILAAGRRARVDVPEIPIIDLSEAADAVRRSRHDQSRHPLPTCFVCGPGRVHGDGLRIIPGPLPSRPDQQTRTVAAPWVPYANLANEGGSVASEFIWAALDCPTGYAAVGAQHLGMTGSETILLGRMSAHIERRPSPGDRCVIAAWPTGRDGRKLFANSALLGSDGKILAVARATWLLVDRQVQLGEG